MSTFDTGMRTTIYLAPPVAKVLERVKAEYLSRYGIAATVSSILSRLLLGDTVDEVIERPYRVDLSRIVGERDELSDALRQALARRRKGDLHRIHRELADLFPRLKQISNTLGRARRRNEPASADLDEAT